MNRFDKELKDALKRVEPPEGFAERVLARLAEERSKPGLLDRIMSFIEAPRLRLAAVAVMSLVIVVGVWRQHEVQQQAEGEQAKQEVMLALKITAKQLQVAEREIRRLNHTR